MYYELKNINGYIALYMPDHHLAKNSPGMFGWVYEHRLVAEKVLGRPLRSNEDVHHLDENKLNNSPDNLLILENGQHVKLHSWLNKNIIVAKPLYAIRKLKGCIRCFSCGTPIDYTEKYCSPTCASLALRKVERPSKEILEEEVKITSLTALGKKYGVSDNAVRKWCISFGIPVGHSRG